MAKESGFLEYKRQDAGHRGVPERIGDYFEIDLPLPEEDLVRQAARCMDCGIPFCHGAGCPVRNRIPEFNDLVYRGHWRRAAENLHATNPFPEVTGRVCPAPCEAACTLNINDDPVIIKHIEYQIAERAWQEGWIQPQPARRKTGLSVAVIGSGPAGLAAAQRLARYGHETVVFEKDATPGGLLRYGIPDFKLNKEVLDRRLAQLQAEGVRFECGIRAGEDVSARYLRKIFDAVCLTMGAGQPRDLDVPGRELRNVHFAMDFLTQQNRRNAGELPADEEPITARDRIVVVIGGGDTGSDCVGTALRQGAKEVHQFEILPQPPSGENPETPWPQWPRILRTSTSQEEGCHRRWSVLTRKLIGRGNQVTELHGVELEWKVENGRATMHEVPDTEFVQPVDLVLLAMGFVHVMHGPLIEQLRVKLDARGNLEVGPDYMSSVEGVFAAGDTTQGASLVVRAIYAGCEAADSIHRWLRR